MKKSTGEEISKLEDELADAEKKISVLEEQIRKYKKNPEEYIYKIFG